MDDRDERLTEIDRALAQALDVDLAPDFFVKVRRRIANEAKPRRAWAVWSIAIPAAAAAALIAAAGLIMLPKRAPAAAQLVTARSVAPGVIRPADDRSPRRVVSHVSPTRISRMPFASVHVRAASEPEVLVPREEIEMYRRLIDAAQHASSALVVEAPPDVAANLPIADIPIDPIRIDPIIPPRSGEGDRQ